MSAAELKTTAKLGPRLDVLLELLEPCALLADVGTDHALVPAHAVLQGKAGRALGVDLREAPLRGARRNLEDLGVSDRVKLLRGDGIATLRSFEVDALVLAGLGGQTLLRWCRSEQDQLRRLRQLLLQPNRHAAALRAWAYCSGFHLTEERLIVDGERPFVTLSLRPGFDPDPAYEGLGVPLEALFELGPHLFRRSEALTRRYYEHQALRLEKLALRGSEEVRAAHHAYKLAVDAVT